MVIDKGELWAIAAMIDGSIGYHGYTSARNRIRNLLEDKYIYACERTSACFGCDSVSEIEHDFRAFSYLEERHPDRVMKIMEFAESTSKLDDWSQTGVGLLYPTMGVGGS